MSTPWAAAGRAAWIGQSAGLIDSVEAAGDVVRRIVADAEEIIAALGR